MSKHKKVVQENHMNTKESITTNYIYSVLYNILAVVLPLFTTPYVSRVLGAEMIGKYGYTQSIVNLFILFGTLGTLVFAQREVAYYQEQYRERSKIFWEMLLFRMLTVGIAIAFFGIKIVFSKQYQLFYIIQIIDLLAAFFDVTWFFQGIEAFKKTVLRNSVVKLSIVGLTFVLVKEPEDIYIYITTFFGAFIWQFVIVCIPASIYPEDSFK